jgi:GNAT superfamily N-acetyltransferase
MPVTRGEHRLDFRDMTEPDLAEGLRLSHACGWNQTLEDWRLLLTMGEGLFLVGLEGGRVVASGGAVRYGDALAWICMILVEPASRGRGLGTRVFDQVLERCAAERRAGRLRAIGLDATPAGRGIYLERGFQAVAVLVRLRVEPAPAAPPAAGVEPLELSSRDAVLALDRAVFGADRARVLQRALEHAPDLAWVARVGERIVGYCFGRHGDHSDHVGPVVAEDPTVARDLAAACLSRARERPLILDARAEPRWLATLEALGFREQRPLTRMYLGEARPTARPALEHAVFGPEFG